MKKSLALTRIYIILPSFLSENSTLSWRKIIYSCSNNISLSGNKKRNWSSCFPAKCKSISYGCFPCVYLYFWLVFSYLNNFCEKSETRWLWSWNTSFFGNACHRRVCTANCLWKEPPRIYHKVQPSGRYSTHQVSK